MAVTTEMVPLENVFNYIPNNLRKTYNDDDQILSYALQAWRNIGVPSIYIKNIAFLVVENHKTTIPKDAVKIVSVWKMSEDADLTYLYECTDEPKNVITQNDTYCTINYKLFKTHSLTEDNFQRMNYVGNYGDSYVCLEAHKGHCGENWSLVPGTNQIQTSIKNGVVLMYYFEELKDKDGKFLLPKKPIVLWKYIAASVSCRIWEDRMSLKEESSMSIYSEYKRQETLYLREVSGYFKGKAINYNNLKNIIYSDTNLAKVPAHLIRRYGDRTIKIKQ